MTKRYFNLYACIGYDNKHGNNFIQTKCYCADRRTMLVINILYTETAFYWLNSTIMDILATTTYINQININLKPTTGISGSRNIFDVICILL